MSLKDITVHDANGIVITPGGNAHHLVADSQPVVNGFHSTDISVMDFAEKVQFTAKSRNSVIDAKTGLVSRAKRSAILSIPVNQPDGSVRFSTIRVEMDVDPVNTSALVDALLSYAVEVMLSAPGNDFWRFGV